MRLRLWVFFLGAFCVAALPPLALVMLPAGEELAWWTSPALAVVLLLLLALFEPPKRLSLSAWRQQLSRRFSLADSNSSSSVPSQSKES